MDKDKEKPKEMQEKGKNHEREANMHLGEETRQGRREHDVGASTRPLLPLHGRAHVTLSCSHAVRFRSWPGPGGSPTCLVLDRTIHPSIRTNEHAILLFSAASLPAAGLHPAGYMCE